MDIFSDGTDPVRDLPAKRPLGVNPENDFYIEQVGRNGYFKIARARGQVPEFLSGTYTTKRKAEEAVKQYIYNNPVVVETKKPKEK